MGVLCRPADDGRPGPRPTIATRAAEVCPRWTSIGVVRRAGTAGSFRRGQGWWPRPSPRSSTTSPPRARPPPGRWTCRAGRWCRQRCGRQRPGPADQRHAVPDPHRRGLEGRGRRLRTRRARRRTCAGWRRDGKRACAVRGLPVADRPRVGLLHADRAAGAVRGMRRSIRDNELGLAFGGLFLATLIGQAFAGLAQFNEQQVAQGAEPVSMPDSRSGRWPCSASTSVSGDPRDPSPSAPRTTTPGRRADLGTGPRASAPHRLTGARPGRVVVRRGGAGRPGRPAGRGRGRRA